MHIVSWTAESETAVYALTMRADYCTFFVWLDTLPDIKHVHWLKLNLIPSMTTNRYKKKSDTFLQISSLMPVQQSWWIFLIHNLRKIIKYT